MKSITSLVSMTRSFKYEIPLI